MSSGINNHLELPKNEIFSCYKKLKKNKHVKKKAFQEHKKGRPVVLSNFQVP